MCRLSSNLVTESILSAVLLLLRPGLANVHVRAMIFPRHPPLTLTSPSPPPSPLSDWAPGLFCSPDPEPRPCVREQWSVGPWGHQPSQRNKMQYFYKLIDPPPVLAASPVRESRGRPPLPLTIQHRAETRQEPAYHLHCTSQQPATHTRNRPIFV